MGLRIFGIAVAFVLVTFALARYRRGQLRRGEMVVISLVCAALALAGAFPSAFDPMLRALGFEPGDQGRITGLLVISNLLTLALVFRGFTRDDQLSDEIGSLVDRIALRRLDGTRATPEGACIVVMPAYNEAENLPAVLAEMPASLGGMEVVVIVVADGCTDATEAVAADLAAKVIGREVRRGSGAAVRLGYEAALNAGARVIVTMDADGQHDPGEMALLVEPLLQGKAQMVQGSRVLGSFESDSRLRNLGVKLFSKVISVLGGVKITDPSTGYRAIVADALRELDLRQDQFYVSEMILDAVRKGIVVTEVPITIRRRAGGESKKPPSLRYAWGFSKAILRTWLR